MQPKSASFIPYAMQLQTGPSSASSVFCSFWHAATSSIFSCKQRLLFLLACSHKQRLHLPAASSVPSGMQPQTAPSASPVVPVPATLPSLEPIVTVYTPVISVLIAGNELAIRCQHVHRRTKENEKTLHVTVMWLSLHNASINTPAKKKTGHANSCHLSLSSLQLVSYIMATLLIGVCIFFILSFIP